MASIIRNIDDRLYRNIKFYGTPGSGNDEKFSATITPMTDYNTMVSDWYSTVGGLEQKKEELKTSYSGSDLQTQIDSITQQQKLTREFTKQHANEYYSPHALIHPYALINLAGASGGPHLVEGEFAYDHYTRRKFYEIDGDDFGGYSKNPTTTTLIRWGNEDKRCRTPYSYQDFIFCKWWNKIENNRLITLRRYAAPVTDNIEFADYDVTTGGETAQGSTSERSWAPLVTAVTYFGDDTGNKLSDLLKFNVKYNWEKMGEDGHQNPYDITSEQSEEGKGLLSGETGGALTSGLGGIAKTMGILADIQEGVNGTGKSWIDPAKAAGALPPDPYSDGPYENRILGPVNVITDTYKRKRGLKFTNEGLKLTFSYVARPVSGINNKAVLLDLMSNMLLMTYSSGSWFGGMWRYRADKAAVYPFKYGDSMNKLYRGELFGKDGAIRTLADGVFKDGGTFASTVFPDVMGTVKNLFKGAFDSLIGKFTGDASTQEAGAKEFSAGLKSNTMKTFGKVLAAKALKGASIPYIKNQRALLTGEPVGDWHLTIGNPLNPIAMIGNLIVTNAEFKFSDELGPDDFPIGFDCTITLEHGLGRDRDAIESMYNRGTGRLYTLPSTFRSSADGETKVDDFTGSSEPRTEYQETRNTYFGGGYRHIVKTQSSDLSNKGSALSLDSIGIKKNATSNMTTEQGKSFRSEFIVQPWQTSFIL